MIGTLVSGLVALIVTVIAIALWFETWLLATGHEPLTWYTRRVENSFPGAAMFGIGLIMVVIGALFAHFVWDAGDENPNPPESQ